MLATHGFQARRFQCLKQLSVSSFAVFSSDCVLRTIANWRVKEGIVGALWEVNPKKGTSAPETGLIASRFRHNELDRPGNNAMNNLVKVSEG
jgi:hypothetical protein